METLFWTPQLMMDDLGQPQSSIIIKQISQDIFECAVQGVALRGASTGCDSSDCLLCQGQRTFCSKEVTDGVSGWLGKRLSGVHEPGAHAAALQRAPSEDSSAVEQPQQQKRKRLKKGSPHFADEAIQEISFEHAADAALDSSTTQLLVSEHTGSPASFGCWTGSGRTWQWREEFASRRSPAPCRMIDIVTLQQPSACAGDSTTQYRKDMISGLEFSTDGQLLAAAGVSKQIALYPLAALQQQHQQQSSCSSIEPLTAEPSAQQWQQPEDAERCLPPVAVVRLPGKVSSIAWSPDMEGVLSVGDYDGTLTQVHVASGHYLNEVDAHGGRRIWSVCHSKLRPHLAATASDDCTAKLWAGRGLAAAVATIRLPGTPAVCGVDFCDWNENLLALAAADHRVHLYDLRRLATPLLTLSGHRRAVSYAKFFGPGQLVSASIDGTLALWDLGPSLMGLDAVPAAFKEFAASASAGSSSQSSSGSSLVGGTAASCCTCGCNGSQAPSQAPLQASSQLQACLLQPCGSGALKSQQQQPPPPAITAGPSPVQRTDAQPCKLFKGHKNEKNFVGLAVLPSAGLMAVGSESSEVYAYHTSWTTPLAQFGMAEQQQLQHQLTQPTALTWPQHHHRQQLQQQQQSVCAVAWQPAFGNSGCCSPAGASLLAAATSAGDCRLLVVQEA